ncbi:hypothetical protein TEA_023364 [Camellia sinensis var. sinensis]|uniref:Uncharacterized protein n=1 Tax=Camellia sinensis var. sinensis TaxID=542762 RepID=A0A4S4E512_CAMSN|nr:hypothetical protein TEA_023364 [Camellia sinensis var. sinensis]
MRFWASRSRSEISGATPVDQTTVPESAVQIFVMSQNVTDNVREDLAWGTYVLLRNTNTISVLISLQDALCVRGYWNTPEDVSKGDALDWFQKQIQRIGLSDLKDTLYFPQSADPELWEMLPKGTRSLLVQPVPHTPKGNANQVEKKEGFVLLVSSISYAYSDKDRAWIGASVAEDLRILKLCWGCKSGHQLHVSIVTEAWLKLSRHCLSLFYLFDFHDYVTYVDGLIIVKVAL